VTLLALPLTAAVLMHAAPTQMGLLTATEIVPFVLFSAADRSMARSRPELPVYVVGELSIAFVVATVRSRGGSAGCRCTGFTSSVS